jgi:hypothetical protein
MNKLLTCLLATLFLFWPTSQAPDFPQVDARVKEQLKAYVRSHHMTPEDYVLSKFKDHDVIFLGENHRFKHDPELVQRLIPLLYQSGIFTLAMEFARHEDQPLIDHLLNAPAYDESLARQIIFNQYVFWGYQEYVDIFKAAWQLNHGLPTAARKFRILGVNCSCDWSVVQKEEDFKDPTVMRRVWRGCDEGDLARVILGEIVAKKEKALVYSGMHHAFTEYRQPIYDEATHSFVRFGDVRMGNHVYQAIGKRAFTIYLHGLWPPAEGYSKPETYAADGYIDAAMDEVEPQFRRAGFDTRGTPFGSLPGEKSIYKHGYDKFKLILDMLGNGVGSGDMLWWGRRGFKFTLGLFCDGYIYQKPLREYEGVTPIKDFVNDRNLPQARLQSDDPRFRNASVEDFYREIAKSTDVRARLAPFR